MFRDTRGGHNRKRVNEDFFKRWTPQMAYVLGFIYADGTVEDCRLSSRACYVGFTNTDKNLLLKIRTLLESNHHIETRKSGPRIIKGKEFFCKDCYTLRIGNKIMYQDLIDLGLCPRKSLVIEVPNIPGDLFKYFLRGYFDGDGCIHVEKNKLRLKIIFTSGSQKFLSQINSIVEIICNVSGFISQNDSAYYLIYPGKKAEAISYLIYQDLNKVPYLDYKYQKYLGYLRLRS